MRKINKIIIHCSATKEGRPYSVNDIDKWHRERGFDCIGYHYIIYLDGTVRAGRSEARMGAHCLGKNAGSIGICYIGGLDSEGRPKDTRTPEQKEALINLLRGLKAKYPNATIHGHREFANKDCPCFEVSEEYKSL